MIERRGDLLFTLVPLKPHQPRGVAQIIGGREVVIKADLIRQVADPPLDRERLPLRIIAEHTGLAVRDVAQAAQHQDGRGLARSVATEQAKDLAAYIRERVTFDDRNSV